MSVSLLLITHDPVGSALLKALTDTLGEDLPLATQAIDVEPNDQPEVILGAARLALQMLDQGDGILVLTDLYGATPCNIAVQLRLYDNVHIISGVNFPMLMKLMSYPDANLATLVEKALSGGHQGIVDCNLNYGTGSC